MPNTFNSSLVLDVLSEKVQTVFANRLAPMRSYSKDFSMDEANQLKAVQVPIATAGSTTLVNPASFEDGDTTVDNIAVTLNHLSQPFHITSTQYNQKFRIENLATINANALAQNMSDRVTALFLSANFTGAAEVVAQASFSATNARSVWGKLAKGIDKHLILSPVAYANLLPTDKNGFDLAVTGAYGFQGVHVQNTFTGATANTYGIAVTPEAIAVAAAIPEMVPGLAAEMIEQRSIQLDGIGLPVQMNLWVSKTTRSMWASYDIMFGAAYGKQADSAILIRSA